MFELGGKSLCDMEGAPFHRSQTKERGGRDFWAPIDLGGLGGGQLFSVALVVINKNNVVSLQTYSVLTTFDIDENFN